MFWKYIAVVVCSLVVMAVGLGLAYAWGLEWLRVVATTAPIAVTGLAVTMLKRRNERADRDEGGDPRTGGSRGPAPT